MLRCHVLYYSALLYLACSCRHISTVTASIFNY
nr:MAG TPA: hypothetical protein [Caudoviricetes sp.]